MNSTWISLGALAAMAPAIRQRIQLSRAKHRSLAGHSRMAKRLASGRPGYLRRRILPEEANRVFALGEIALEIPRETDRYYPQGTLGAHVLGYVVEEEGGKIGMEEVLQIAREVKLRLD